MKTISLVCSVLNVICSLACMTIIWDYFFKVRELKKRLTIFEDMVTRIASNLTHTSKGVETLGGICGTHEEIIAHHAEALDSLNELADLNRIHFDALDELAESERKAHVEIDKVFKSTQDEIRVLYGKVDELRTTFDETIKELATSQMEKARAEARSEELWSEGLSSIMDYGLTAARLNVEAMNGNK